MKPVFALFALLAMGLSQPLLAHTSLRTSSPAEGASVTAPSEIRLAFSAQVKLTAVKLQDAAGTETTLGSIPADPAASFSIAIPATLAAGNYVVVWRSVSGDSHIVSGEINFTVTD